MKQRIISAIIALAIFIPVLILGGIYFKVAVSLVGILAIKEVLAIKKDIPGIIKIISYLLVAILIFANIDSIVKIFIILFAYFMLLIFFDKEIYNINDCTYLSGFLILITLVFSYFCSIRNSDINVLIYLFLITIFTDTFAYLGGKLFGKHKLIERISPNKTIEGSVIGSIMGTLFPSAFYIYMINPSEYLFVVALITITLSIIGQFGDLIFSSIKRYYKIKDFSNILPGHGGVLDRLDSIIFVLIGYIILISLI